MTGFQMTVVAVSATLLLAGTGLTRAADETAATQTQTQEQTRMQAMESVKQRLKEDPKDEGLRHAEQCLDRSEQCQDTKRLNQAMESVRHNMEKHPDDNGLRHAMEHLERHHERLEKKHMDRERSMHREDSGRPEKTERHNESGGMYR